MDEYLNEFMNLRTGVFLCNDFVALYITRKQNKSVKNHSKKFQNKSPLTFSQRSRPLSDKKFLG